MSFDLYSACPCSSGKKVKHCCGKPAFPSLQKIVRALEGDQRRGAMNELRTALKKHGDLPCLLTLKLETEFLAAEVSEDGGSFEEARETVQKLQKVAPENRNATVYAATMAAMEGDPAAATQILQKDAATLEAGEKLPPRYENAFLATGIAWAKDGNYLGARGHFMCALALTRGENEDAWEMLNELTASPSMPLSLKLPRLLERRPEDAAWGAAFDEINPRISWGDWQRNVVRLEELAKEHPADPVLLGNIALLWGWLGEQKKATDYWNQAALCESAPLDDAVESRLRAVNMLQVSEAGHADTLDEVRVTFEIEDFEKVKEVLIASRQTESINADLNAFRPSEDTPPPRGLYRLMSKPAPGADDKIESLEDVPTDMALLMLFGKETGRAARVEALMLRDYEYDSSIQLIQQTLGDHAAAPSEPELEREGTVLDWLFEWEVSANIRRAMDPVLAGRLHTAFVQRKLTEPFLGMKLKQLDDRSLEEAAGGDHKDRVYALAVLLEVELLAGTLGLAVDVNAAREKLNLPQQETIDPTKVENLQRIADMRLHRLDAEMLSDAQLDYFARHALQYCATAAVRELTPEVLLRDEIEAELKVELCHHLATRSTMIDTALKHAVTARNLAADNKMPVGMLLMLEARLRLLMGEVEPAINLVRTAAQRHQREPGVAQAVENFARQFGPPPGAAPQPGPAQPAGESGGLWTPDQGSASAAIASAQQDSSAAEGESKPSKLILPD